MPCAAGTVSSSESSLFVGWWVGVPEPSLLISRKAQCPTFLAQEWKGRSQRADDPEGGVALSEGEQAQQGRAEGDWSHGDVAWGGLMETLSSTAPSCAPRGVLCTELQQSVLKGNDRGAVEAGQAVN